MYEMLEKLVYLKNFNLYATRVCSETKVIDMLSYGLKRNAHKLK